MPAESWRRALEEAAAAAALHASSEATHTAATLLGRPPKAAKAATVGTAVLPGGVPRKRGRPPKAAKAATVGTAVLPGGVPRKRGRPSNAEVAQRLALAAALPGGDMVAEPEGKGKKAAAGV
jgi:hypothetical protein